MIYSGILMDLHAEFTKIEESLELVSHPFLYDHEKAPPNVQHELIDLQCDSNL